MDFKDDNTINKPRQTLILEADEMRTREMTKKKNAEPASRSPDTICQEKNGLAVDDSCFYYRPLKVFSVIFPLCWHAGD